MSTDELNDHLNRDTAAFVTYIATITPRAGLTSGDVAPIDQLTAHPTAETSPQARQ